MSLDYPLYVELRKISRAAGIFWRVGDSAYYLGIILSFIWPFIVLFYLRKSDETWISIVTAVGVGLVAFVILAVFGAFLKGISYRIVEKRGWNLTRLAEASERTRRLEPK